MAGEIAEMKEIVDKTAANLVVTQDLGLGMMLWMTQFLPEELACSSHLPGILAQPAAEG